MTRTGFAIPARAVLVGLVIVAAAAVPGSSAARPPDSPGARTGAAAGALAESGPARSDRRGPEAVDVVLAVHGGAGGGLDPATTPPERERAYRDGLRAALSAGYAVLRRGGSSLDAVQAAVTILEDNPLFNAGRGAVFNTDAAHELDASIMDGRTLDAGAVSGVQHVRNPIAAARLVMESSPHVMLSGAGADEFAARRGLPTVTQDYYFTEARWQALLAAKNPPAARAGRAAAPAPDPGGETVGAVARARNGDLAAATSTGGLTNKMVGRIGDSPIIGAGTYAENGTVCVSATGTGEVFIRGVAASDIAAQMRYARAPVWEAARRVVTEKLPRLGGTGGVIALDARGRLATPRSTPGLLRGWVTADGRITTRVLTTE
ncbi:MAG TPA: isoaspartyl peptidase/L-asparaginase [Pilimelia sp.]|nr:isoaspartyl peptidase/L-asparaginase [Pilimelia sp.]